MAIVESFACVVGGFYLSYLLLKSLKFIFEAFQTIFSEGNVNFKSFGEWAGIIIINGHAYAQFFH